MKCLCCHHDEELLSPQLPDEPESLLAPELPADHADLLAKINAELKRILPPLLRVGAEALELPRVAVLAAPPDLKKDGLPVVKLELNFNNWKYLRVRYLGEHAQVS